MKHVNRMGVVLVEYTAPSAQLMCVHSAEGHVYTLLVFQEKSLVYFRCFFPRKGPLQTAV
jgi:hypothetical protein